MKRMVVTAILCLVASQVLAAEAVPLAEDEAVEARMIAITEELRCLVCQNESIAASRAPLADDLRRETREMIIQGRSDREIREFMVERYGDFVLYRPPLKGTTLALWFGPFLLVLIGIAGLLFVLRRRERQGGEVALTDDDRRKIDLLLGKQKEGDRS